MPPLTPKGTFTPSINEETRRAYRRQAFWQIFFPLLIGILIAIILFALMMRSGTGTIERSAQAATILLAIPLLVGGFALMFLLIVLTSGINRFMKWLPPKSYRAQRLAQQLSSGTTQISNVARQPFVLIESWGNALNRALRRKG